MRTRPVPLRTAWVASWAWARSEAVLAGSAATRAFSWELRLSLSWLRKLLLRSIWLRELP